MSTVTSLACDLCQSTRRLYTRVEKKNVTSRLQYDMRFEVRERALGMRRCTASFVYTPRPASRLRSY